MSLLNFNSSNRSWNIYTTMLSSISGDHLTIKPYEGQNLLLEVSGNNNIFIKKGDISYNLSNLITGSGTSTSIVSGSDASFTNIDVSGNLNPLNDNAGSLGSTIKRWGNAYIRDISATNISISGTINVSGNIINVRQIIPQLTNDISSSLGTSQNIWQKAFIRDLSGIATINGSTLPLIGSTGATGPAGSTGPTGPTGLTGTAGSIGSLITTQRIYQNISGDISWNDVNGDYVLAQDAYPALNPSSSGVKAITGLTRTGTVNSWWVCCCWSPELGLFVAGAQNNSNVMISFNGINWSLRAAASFQSICWSPELRLFVAVSSGAVHTSSDGITWSPRTGIEASNWFSVCWSPQLMLFVAVAQNGTNRTMSSRDGITWIAKPVTGLTQWLRVCWSPEVGRFVACGSNASPSVMYSRDGITWQTLVPPAGGNWQGLCWSSQLGLFVITSRGTDNNILTSPDGVTWTGRTAINTAIMYSQCLTWIPELGLFISCTSGTEIQISRDAITWSRITVSAVSADCRSISWSPELGIFVAPTLTSALVITSSLKGCPPTSYNVFDSSFNSIDETGKWTFLNLNAITLRSNGASVASDDRLKHNEVIINNGLAIIDQLTPKFYQKTLTMLDASYNGDLSGYAWTHEAGLIAQELLQITDLSYVVSGGDYYEETYNLIAQTNDISYNTNESSYYEVSNANYEVSNANYEVSNANYEVSKNYEARPYNVNYNSVFIYGLAAIKELHTKVKAQETIILDEQLNNLISRVEALE